MQLRRLPRCCCWVGVGLLVKGCRRVGWLRGRSAYDENLTRRNWNQSMHLRIGCIMIKTQAE
jgi:hypothetical protein